MNSPPCLQQRHRIHCMSPPPPGGDSHLKRLGCSSLRGVTQGFWSHLRCSWWNTVERLQTDTSLMKTPLVFYVLSQFSMYWQKSTTFPLKNLHNMQPLKNGQQKINFGPGEQIHTILTPLLWIPRGPGANDSRCVPFHVGSYTNIDPFSLSNTNTCQNVSFQNLHLQMQIQYSAIENSVAIAISIFCIQCSSIQV